MIRRGGNFILLIGTAILTLVLTCVADEADRSFKKATEYRLSGKLERAIQLYRKTVETSKEPLSEHALYHIGEGDIGGLGKMGRVDRSLPSLSEEIS